MNSLAKQAGVVLDVEAIRQQFLFYRARSMISRWCIWIMLPPHKSRNV